MKNRTKYRVIEGVAAIFILLFTYTAVSKLLDRLSFQNILHESFLLAPVSIPLSWAIPIVEIGIAVLLLLPAQRKRGLFLSFILMLLFTFYVAGMLLLAVHRPCSCGGVIARMSWPQHLWFNCILSILAFAAWRWSKPDKFIIAINPGVTGSVRPGRPCRTPVEKSRRLFV